LRCTVASMGISTMTTHVPLHVFFQAEDGIRSGHVTGVQTCALPIFMTVPSFRRDSRASLIQPRSSSRGPRGACDDVLRPRAPTARDGFGGVESQETER